MWRRTHFPLGELTSCQLYENGNRSVICRVLDSLSITSMYKHVAPLMSCSLKLSLSSQNDLIVKLNVHQLIAFPFTLVNEFFFVYYVHSQVSYILFFYVHSEFIFCLQCLHAGYPFPCLQSGSPQSIQVQPHLLFPPQTHTFMKQATAQTDTLSFIP